MKNIARRHHDTRGYEFWLNAGRFEAFRSAEGVPLESVHVTFKMAGKAE